MFGDVHVDIGPRRRGEGFEFTDKIVGGSIPKQFIPAVEAGIKEFSDKGPLGFPVVDFAVKLTDGQFHAVDSNEMSFKLAARVAMSEGLPKCAPVLLEPISKVDIDVPTEFTFLTVKAAGHMVPTFKPAEALAMVTRFVRGEPY